MINNKKYSGSVFLFNAVLFAAFAISCGSSGKSPILKDLRCINDNACQSKSDPFLLELMVDFQDEDGDLGAGTYSVYVDKMRTMGSEALLPFFNEADISPYATEGTLILPAPLQISGLYSGKVFTVSIEVTDFAGNTSNRPGLIMRIDM